MPNANEKDKKSQRDGFGQALLELGETNPDVVVLTADLSESTRVQSFEKMYPQRFVQVGVAEQNMAGIASGLALSGKIPFMASFGIFSPGNNWLQVRTSICYSNANVKIIGTHAGLSASSDGATHQALEDIAITRVLPNLTVIVPADYHETKKAVKAASEHIGPIYIRLSRDSITPITEEKSDFNIGKAQILQEGDDITVIFCGPIGAGVMTAVNELKKDNDISCEVINCSTIKPLDEKTILGSVKKTGKVVTVEEHQVSGGLGGAVSELLSEKLPVKIVRVGVKDTFGESGKYDELLDKYGLSSEHIGKAIVTAYKETAHEQ